MSLKLPPNNTTTSHPTREWLTVNQTADLLGVTPRSIRNYLVAKRKPLPHSKAGGNIRIRVDDLYKWMER